MAKPVKMSQWAIGEKGLVTLLKGGPVTLLHVLTIRSCQQFEFVRDFKPTLVIRKFQYQFVLKMLTISKLLT